MDDGAQNIPSFALTAMKLRATIQAQAHCSPLVTLLPPDHWLQRIIAATCTEGALRFRHEYTQMRKGSLGWSLNPG